MESAEPLVPPRQSRPGATDRPNAWPYRELLPPRQGILFIVSGPSGVGKDAVIARLRAVESGLTWIVTATTRPMRLNEREGEPYHFLTEADFSSKQQKGELLESACVYGNWYGTPIEPVRLALHEGRDVILKIDVQGTAQVRQRFPETVTIFIGPTSMQELADRLRGRGTEAADVFTRRLDVARDEMLQLPLYDYLVVNSQGDLDCAVSQMQAIITAERLRVQARRIRL